MNKLSILMAMLLLSSLSFAADKSLENSILGKQSSEFKQQSNQQKHRTIKANKHRYHRVEPHYRNRSQYRFEVNRSNRFQSSHYRHTVYPQHDYRNPSYRHSQQVVVYYVRDGYGLGHWHDDFWCDNRHDDFYDEYGYDHYYEELDDDDWYGYDGWYDYDDWFFD